jgi:cytosine/adenosine deaminase-related metal-dependent hydrolase
MAALYAATAEPARFLGVESGRVAPRHAADLAILDANPLDDIANTKRLSGVVVRGRYIDAAERLAILAEVERVAATAPATAATPCPCHAPLR